MSAPRYPRALPFTLEAYGPSRVHRVLPAGTDPFGVVEQLYKAAQRHPRITSCTNLGTSVQATTRSVDPLASYATCRFELNVFLARDGTVLAELCVLTDSAVDGSFDALFAELLST